jgi:prevent-host-death family protein
MAVPLTEAGSRLGELVNQARHGHEPVTITEHGKPVVALINVDDLADLEDGLALAKHLADKAGRTVTGFTDDELDAAMDRYRARNA